MSNQHALPANSARRLIVTAQTRAAIEQQAYLTPREVSEIMRVSVYTVRRWILDGELPASKVGRGWRISEPAIQTWLEQRRAGALDPH
jgi:excisionase family DNA binding protein